MCRVVSDKQACSFQKVTSRFILYSLSLVLSLSSLSLSIISVWSLAIEYVGCHSESRGSIYLTEEVHRCSFTLYLSPSAEHVFLKLHAVVKNSRFSVSAVTHEELLLSLTSASVLMNVEVELVAVKDSC